MNFAADYGLKTRQLDFTADYGLIIGSYGFYYRLWIHELTAKEEGRAFCELLTKTFQFFRISGKNGGRGCKSSEPVQLLQDGWQVRHSCPVNQGEQDHCQA